MPKNLGYSVVNDLVVGREITTIYPSLECTESCSFSILSGSLPDGLKLDSATGAVSGTPLRLNNSECILQIAATNQHGACSTQVILKILDAMAPANMQLNTEVDLIFGIPAPAILPVLGTPGAPYTKFRVCSPSIKKIEDEMLKNQTCISELSLQEVVTICLKAGSDMDAWFKGAASLLLEVKTSLRVQLEETPNRLSVWSFCTRERLTLLARLLDSLETFLLSNKSFKLSLKTCKQRLVQICCQLLFP
jgi:hypothetical protein